MRVATKITRLIALLSLGLAFLFSLSTANATGGYYGGYSYGGYSYSGYSYGKSKYSYYGSKKYSKKSKYSKSKYSKYKYSKKKKYNYCKSPDPKTKRICEGICNKCDGGLSSLVLQYNGAAGAHVAIYGYNGVRYYSGSNLQPGDEITIEGSYSRYYGHRTLSHKLKIYVNGWKKAKIYTDCDHPVGPGSVFGDFTVVEAYNKAGGALCPNGEEPACTLCDGKVTSLSMEYTGSEPATVAIYNSYWDLKFGPAMVSPGEEISIGGGGYLGHKLYVYVNDVKESRIELDCDDPVGPGAQWGSFLITHATSSKGGAICPVSPEGCKACKGGVSVLNVEYIGDDSAHVKVKDEHWNTLFSGEVSPEDVIELGSEGVALGRWLKFYVNGRYTKVYTNCHDDLGSGVVIGSKFLVKYSESVDNGPICGCGDPPPVDDAFDFGDAPESYGSASHVILPDNNPYIGNTPPDAEDSSQFSVDAQGDDLSNIDDEGAIVANGNPFICGASTAAGATPNFAIPVTGDGFLNVWFDANGNGSFANGVEHVVQDVAASSEEVLVSFNIPFSAQSGFVRIRFTSQAGIGPDGLAPDGEVEDCVLNIVNF